MIFDKELNTLNTDIYDSKAIKDLALLIISKYDDFKYNMTIRYSIKDKKYYIGRSFYNDSFLELSINFNLFKSTDFEHYFVDGNIEQRISFLNKILIKKISSAYNKYLKLVFNNSNSKDILIRDIDEDNLIYFLSINDISDNIFLTAADKEKLQRVLFKKQLNIRLTSGVAKIISILEKDYYSRLELVKKVLLINPDFKVSHSIANLFTSSFKTMYNRDYNMDISNEDNIKLLKCLEELYELNDNKFDFMSTFSEEENVCKTLAKYSDSFYHFCDLNNHRSLNFEDINSKYYMTVSDYNDFNKQLSLSIFRGYELFDFFDVFKDSKVLLDPKLKENIMRVLDSHNELYGEKQTEFKQIIDNFDIFDLSEEHRIKELQYSYKNQRILGVTKIKKVGN